MSNRDFVKGECEHCTGHLEFPADASGQTVPCPHCGQPTQLTGPAGKTTNATKRRLIIGGCFLAAGLSGALFLAAKHGATAEPKPSPTARSNAPAMAKAAPAAPPEPKFAVQTNDFGILTFQLEKTEGSSLVYVTGTLRNLADRQRFGVKVAFEVFDTNDQPAGSATDYQSMIDPRGDWSFKALVMGSKAASAVLQSISEDK